MKQKILILSIIFLILLIANTPAKLVEYLLPAQKNVLLSGFEGSVWSGRVDHVSLQGVTLQDVNFSFSFWSLLLFDPQIDLQIPQGDIEGNLTVHINGQMQNEMNLEDVSVKLDAALLEKYMPVKGVVLNGVIYTQGLTIELQNSRPVLLEGQLEWQKASLEYAGQKYQLGDFSIFNKTDPDTHSISAELAKTKNALGLEGTILLTADGTVEINGSIATDIDPNIYKTLALFNNGKPENNRLPIKFKQKLL